MVIHRFVYNRDRTMQADPGSLRTATLFVRADPDPASEQTIRTALERLRELTDSGAVDGYEVVPWGRTFSQDGPLAGTAYHKRIAGYLDAFEHWAARTDACLDWSFQCRTVESSIVNADNETVSLPVVALAIYEQGALSFVAPTREESVPAALSQLERLDADRPLLVGLQSP